MTYIYNIDAYTNICRCTYAYIYIYMYTYMIWSHLVKEPPNLATQTPTPSQGISPWSDSRPSSYPLRASWGSRHGIPGGLVKRRNYVVTSLTSWDFYLGRYTYIHTYIYIYRMYIYIECIYIYTYVGLCRYICRHLLLPQCSLHCRVILRDWQWGMACFLLGEV